MLLILKYAKTFVWIFTKTFETVMGLIEHQKKCDRDESEYSLVKLNQELLSSNF